MDVGWRLPPLANQVHGWVRRALGCEVLYVSMPWDIRAVLALETPGGVTILLEAGLQRYPRPEPAPLKEMLQVTMNPAELSQYQGHLQADQANPCCPRLCGWCTWL